jgi:sigma-E factor negative regulatory protein RseC
MIVETGRVTNIEDNKAIVEIEKGGSCASCSTRCACNYGAKTVLVEAENPLNAGKDQLVQISIPEGSALQAAFVVYVIPLIALIAGILLGEYVGECFGIAIMFEILGGIAGLALSLLVIRYYNKVFKRRNTEQPVVTKVIKNDKDFS